MQTRRSWTAVPETDCPGWSLARGYREMGAEMLIKIAGGMTLSKSPSYSISLSQQHEEYV